MKHISVLLPILSVCCFACDFDAKARQVQYAGRIFEISNVLDFMDSDISQPILKKNSASKSELIGVIDFIRSSWKVMTNLNIDPSDSYENLLQIAQTALGTAFLSESGAKNLQNSSNVGKILVAVRNLSEDAESTLKKINSSTLPIKNWEILESEVKELSSIVDTMKNGSISSNKSKMTFVKKAFSQYSKQVEEGLKLINQKTSELSKEVKSLNEMSQIVSRFERSVKSWAGSQNLSIVSKNNKLPETEAYVKKNIADMIIWREKFSFMLNSLNSLSAGLGIDINQEIKDEEDKKNEIKSLHEDLKNIKQTLESYSQNISGLSGQVNNLQETSGKNAIGFLEQVKEIKDSSDKNINDLTQRLNNLNEKFDNSISSLSEQVKQNANSSLEASNNNISALSEQIKQNKDSTDQSINALTTQINTSLEASNNNVSAQIKQVKDSTDQSISALTTQINTSLEASNNNISALSEQIKQNKDSTDQSINALTTQINTSLEASNNNISALSEQIKQNKDSTDQSINALTTQINTSLEASNNNVSAQIKQVKDSADQSINALTTQINALTSQLNTLQEASNKNTTTFSEQIKAVTESIKQKDAQISLLNAFMTELKKYPTAGYPNFNSGVNKPWNKENIAESNGWIFVHTIHDWSCQFIITIDGKRVFISHKPRNRETAFLPVMKGQKYKVMGGREVFELTFYPCIVQK